LVIGIVAVRSRSAVTKRTTRDATTIYARYSTDPQRDVSIVQIRLCLARIEREGWHYLHAYTDRAVSGASALRPAYQILLEVRAVGNSKLSSPKRSTGCRGTRRISPGCSNG
jgi:Resolvase, N terminal domain